MAKTIYKQKNYSDLVVRVGLEVNTLHFFIVAQKFNYLFDEKENKLLNNALNTLEKNKKDNKFVSLDITTKISSKAAVLFSKIEKELENLIDSKETKKSINSQNHDNHDPHDNNYMLANVQALTRQFTSQRSRGF